MKFAICSTLLLSITTIVPLAQTLLIVSAPRGEVFPDSLVRIAVAANPPGKFAAGAADSCALYRGPVAAGNALAGHDTRLIAAKSLSPDSAAVVFAFKPADNDPGKTAPQLGLGFHYLIVSCGDGKSLSPELPFWVATRQAATLTAPKAQETSSSPNITWTPVPGVPAYHLLLSDQALDIDAEKGTVSGASIIWQAITTKSSISYGTPDPSGNFSKVPAPPLSPNVPYNLVVLNNYDGRSSLSTSTKAQGLKLFTIQPSGPALQPSKNLAPAPDALLSASMDSSITFRWTRSRSASGGAATATANTYQVFIYSLETQDGLEVLFPIWRTDVTDTFAVLDAKRTLLTKRYIWKVFALSETGASVVGDTTSFGYRNDVQTLSLTVRSDGSDPKPLGDVRIEVSPLDGSADALPLFTTNTGAAEKVLAVGSYSLAFAKDGYLTQKRVVTLDLRFPLSLVQTLPAAAARISGRVADGTGADLVNASVTASGGGLTVTGVSDAQGYFLLGVGAGSHAVSVSKPDYQSRPDTTVSVAAGKSLDLGRLTLSRAQGSLTGTVSNDKGVPLSGCQITIKTTAGALVRSLLTDDRGLFSAFLAPGSYSVIAARTGFTSDRKMLQLTDAANLAFTLASGASLLKGRVAASFRPTSATTQSSPLPGAALELIDRLRGSAQKTAADLRGEYSFSSDTGTFLLKASATGKAGADSQVVRIASARSTVIQDLTLKGFASVQGTLRLSPDTLIDPAQASVSLLDPSTSHPVASAAPRGAPLPGSAGAMAFSVDGVPDGTYRLSVGVAGFGLDPEPVLTLSDGVWKTGLDLTMVQAVKTLTVFLTVGGDTVDGVIRLIAPRALELSAGSKLTQAPSGTYALTAAADSVHVIPVTGFTFFLPPTGSPDTSITLALPFSHRSGPIEFKDGEAELVLEASAGIDSALGGIRLWLAHRDLPGAVFPTSGTRRGPHLPIPPGRTGRHAQLLLHPGIRRPHLFQSGPGAPVSGRGGAVRDLARLKTRLRGQPAPGFPHPGRIAPARLRCGGTAPGFGRGRARGIRLDRGSGFGHPAGPARQTHLGLYHLHGHGRSFRCASPCRSQTEPGTRQSGAARSKSGTGLGSAYRHRDPGWHHPFTDPSRARGRRGHPQTGAHIHPGRGDRPARPGGIRAFRFRIRHLHHSAHAGGPHRRAQPGSAAGRIRIGTAGFPGSGFHRTLAHPGAADQCRRLRGGHGAGRGQGFHLARPQRRPDLGPGRFRADAFPRS